MKLFKYQMGTDEKLAVAKDEKEAYDNRAKVDHTFNFLPVQITEVKIEGYEITLKPIGEDDEPHGIEAPIHPVHTMDIEDLNHGLTKTVLNTTGTQVRKN